MKLFVVPQNINFELQTNIRKVTFDKMLFEQVHGAVDIKDQYIYLKDLSMIALGATDENRSRVQGKQPKASLYRFRFPYQGYQYRQPGRIYSCTRLDSADAALV